MNETKDMEREALEEASLEQAYIEYELSKFTNEQLQEELDSRTPVKPIMGETITMLKNFSEA